MTIQDYIAEVRERLEKVGLRPWWIEPDGDGLVNVRCGPPEEKTICAAWCTTEDGELIAHAPADLSRLCTALERAVEGLEWYHRNGSTVNAARALADIEKILEGK